VVCIHKPNWSIQISGDMIKISPPRKGGKSPAPTESKKTGSSKASDGESQFTVSGTAKGNAGSAESAASDSNSFSVKAPQKNTPKPPTRQSKDKVASAVPPPKKKSSPKVQVAEATPNEDASKAGETQKSHIAPPKKKNVGQAKANVAAAVPELSAEDAYDYEL
jgi:hypothetical protein